MTYILIFIVLFYNIVFPAKTLNTRHKNLRLSLLPSFVTLSVHSLDSETSWTGELSSMTNLLE